MLQLVSVFIVDLLIVFFLLFYALYLTIALLNRHYSYSSYDSWNDLSFLLVYTILYLYFYNKNDLYLY